MISTSGAGAALKSGLPDFDILIVMSGKPEMDARHRQQNPMGSDRPFHQRIGLPSHRVRDFFSRKAREKVALAEIDFAPREMGWRIVRLPNELATGGGDLALAPIQAALGLPRA